MSLEQRKLWIPYYTLVHILVEKVSGLESKNNYDQPQH